jgi:hypothetical protein
LLIVEGLCARLVRFALFVVRGTLWNILEGLGARWVRFAHFELWRGLARFGVVWHGWAGETPNSHVAK